METILSSLRVHHRKIHWYQMVDLRYAPSNLKISFPSTLPPKETISVPIYDPEESPSDEPSIFTYLLSSPVSPDKTIPMSTSDIADEKPSAYTSVVPQISPSYQPSLRTSLRPTTRPLVFISIVPSFIPSAISSVSQSPMTEPFRLPPF